MYVFKKEMTAADMDTYLQQGAEVFVHIPRAYRHDYGMQRIRNDIVFVGIMLGYDDAGNCIVASYHDQSTHCVRPELIVPMGGKWEN